VDVLSNTPITTYDVLGEDIRNNQEVQGAKTRAGEIKALAVRLQHGNQFIGIWIYQNGTVTFLDYPGDYSGLGLLSMLNQIIGNNSELVLATVR
jgi:hypothetical protein